MNEYLNFKNEIINNYLIFMRNISRRDYFIINYEANENILSVHYISNSVLILIYNIKTKEINYNDLFLLTYFESITSNKSIKSIEANYNNNNIIEILDYFDNKLGIYYLNNNNVLDNIENLNYSYNKGLINFLKIKSNYDIFINFENNNKRKFDKI